MARIIRHRWQDQCEHMLNLVMVIAISEGIKVRPATRDWACQTERCHTLSNKTSLQ